MVGRWHNHGKGQGHQPRRKIPFGWEETANEFWHPGGFTSGGVIEAVVDQDPAYSWFSLYYLVALIRINKEIDVNLDLKDLISSIRKNIKINKDFLAHDKRWIGNEFEEGLWGDVRRMTNNIRINYGIDINLEENS